MKFLDPLLEKTLFTYILFLLSIALIAIGVSSIFVVSYQTHHSDFVIEVPPKWTMWPIFISGIFATVLGLMSMPHTIHRTIKKEYRSSDMIKMNRILFILVSIGIIFFLVSFAVPYTVTFRVGQEYKGSLNLHGWVTMAEMDKLMETYEPPRPGSYLTTDIAMDMLIDAGLAYRT